MSLISNLFFPFFDFLMILVIAAVIIVLVYFGRQKISGKKVAQILLVDGLIGSIVAAVLTTFILQAFESYQVKQLITDQRYYVCVLENGTYVHFGFSKMQHTPFSGEFKMIGEDLKHKEILIGKGELIADRYLLATYKSMEGPNVRRIGTFSYEMGSTGDFFEGTFTYIDHQNNSFQNGKAKWIKKPKDKNNPCL